MKFKVDVTSREVTCTVHVLCEFYEPWVKLG